MTQLKKIKNVGFISTRLQGTDGVSLETEKWIHVLKKLGYECFYFAGLSNWDKERTMVVPEAFFEHPEIKALHHKCFSAFNRTKEMTESIYSIRYLLKTKLYEFLAKFNIDMLIIENALAIPINIPLGIAITELIAETGTPTIAHHHDFYWERQRFTVNCVNDYIEMAFPPSIPTIQHVVINSQADKDLSYRRGLSPHTIPNVLNYRIAAPGIDDYNKNVRKDLGLKKDDLFFLQPTRIIARKGIEHAIEVINRMNNPHIKLVITHQSKDEGSDYERRVRSYAKLLKVPLIIRDDIIKAERGTTENGKKIYSLWDIYPHADFITYPSTYEGFGNAFLEAIYFKKPILVNRYSIYQRDIEPLGFEVVPMDTFIQNNVIHKIKTILENPKRREKMAEKNYKIAAQFFSYELLEYKLKNIIINFEGVPAQIPQ